MTAVIGRLAGSRMAVPGSHRARPGRASARPSRLPLTLVSLSAAAGVLVVALAYTAGRFGHASSPWADRAYWLGQALIVVPAAVRLLGRRLLTGAQTAAVVIMLTTAEYLVKVCYSPAGFAFPDELEHWRATVGVLQTGRLFRPDYVLPISARYPGLEEVTSALSAITGLSVFVSGLIVAGVAHLLFVCLLYLLFRHVSGSSRVAGIAVLCYAANSHFQTFDSVFSYQTLALAFLGLALLAAWRLTSATGGERASWFAVAGAAIVALTVTHHITSYVLVATLLLVTLVTVPISGWRAAGRLSWPAAAAVVAAGSWLLLAAPQTIGYLRPATSGILEGFGSLFTGGSTGAAAVATGPLGDQVLSVAAVLIMSALIPLGWREVWQRHRRQPWLVAMSVGSVSWYIVVVLRLAVPDGSELTGRASTFAFVPAALVAALGLARLVQATRGRPLRRTVIAATALGGALALMAGGLANGWPPFWERLPGPHQVAGFERSVGPDNIAAARWALAYLGPGNRFGTDLGSYAVLGGYGDQDPVRNARFLYTSPASSVLAEARTQSEAIRYVFVDHRLAQSLPASGQYFPVDPAAGTYTRPLPAAGLRKFDHIGGASRIYDAGNIVIYDLRGSEYAP
jgi:hypothetical protein